LLAKIFNSYLKAEMSNTFTLGLAKVWIGWMREVDLPTVAYWTDIHHAF